MFTRMARYTECRIKNTASTRMGLGQRGGQVAMVLRDPSVGGLAELAISATNSEQNVTVKVHVHTASVSIQYPRLGENFTDEVKSQSSA